MVDGQLLTFKGEECAKIFEHTLLCLILSTGVTPTDHVMFVNWNIKWSIHKATYHNIQTVLLNG